MIHYFKILIALVVFFFCMVIDAGLAAGQVLTARIINYRHQPVSSAEVTLTGADGYCQTAITDENGEFILTLTAIHTPENLPQAFDLLDGLDYHLASSRGTIVMYNLLGRRLAEYELERGRQRLQLPAMLPAGRYFSVMKTPNFHGISSFTVLDGHIVAKSKPAYQYSPFINRENLRKSLAGYTLSGSKSGYEPVVLALKESDLDNDQPLLIRMNKIPVLTDQPTDTLRPGDTLPVWIDNDDAGSWHCITAQIAIDDNRIVLSDSSRSLCDSLTLVYSDSVNPALQVEVRVLFRYIRYADASVNNALVLVVDSKGGIANDQLDYLYNHSKTTLLPIMADLFGVEESVLQGLSFNQIVDLYGEPWQIDEIERLARPVYDRVMILNDEAVNFPGFCDSLLWLRDRDYVIDLMFVLHEGAIGADYESLAAFIANNNIRVRSLYQTCCNGHEAIAPLTGIGVRAVSGAVGTNSLTVFSPIYFLRNWIEGDTFAKAVENACDQAIDKFFSYEELRLGMIVFFSSNALEESRQLVGGTRPELLWFEYGEEGDLSQR